MSNVIDLMKLALAGKLGYTVQMDDLVQHGTDNVFYNIHTGQEFLVLKQREAYERAKQHIMEGLHHTVDSHMVDAWPFFDAEGYAQSLLDDTTPAGVLSSDGQELSLGMGFVAYRVDENDDELDQDILV